MPEFNSWKECDKYVAELIKKRWSQKNVGKVDILKQTKGELIALKYSSKS